MKKIIFLLLSFITIAAYSQKTDLVTVNTVKPKYGQKMAFEAAYKLHISKFHKAGEMMNTYEILSGTYQGYYHLTTGGRSYADFDKERADATAHSLDLDKNLFPYLQETMNGTFRFIDSFSLHTNVQAEKFVVNARHIKPSLLNDYKVEVAKAIRVDAKLKGEFWDNLSLNGFEQLWPGTDPVIVTIRNLKDGFKSLEPDYYGAGQPGPNAFKDGYIKEYGAADWDKRVKLLEEAVVKNDQYIMKLRKDLSAQ